ncbi:MAG: hypothetical protein JWQ32_2003 [Marmoricola sp.]|nr:hypothetical protein [Marmoricola sp.]
MTRPRFLTGGLATLAVASAFTLSTPAAHAEGSADTCGQSAVAPVYTTVVHDPIFRTVPATTHQEWRWQRDVPSTDFEYTKVITPARDETDWTRTVSGAVEYLFARTVTDQPAVPGTPAIPEVGHFNTVVITPAVTVLQDEYQHQVTGKLRWESPDWGAQNGNGDGWVKTGNTRELEITPAVTEQVWVIDVPGTPATPGSPAVTHVETQWAPSLPTGDGWTGPIDTRTADPTTETVTTDGPPPAGAGWTVVATRHVDAVVDTVWASSAPDGYTATGAEHPGASTHEETDVTSAAAPAGDGWSAIDATLVTITDTPASQVLVTPGSVDQVLVTPGHPATAPCPGAVVAGPQAAPAVHGSVAASVAAPVAPARLPNTGGVPGWMAPSGFAAALAGAVLIRATRRHVDR